MKAQDPAIEQEADVGEQGPTSEDENGTKKRRHLLAHWLLALVSIVLFFLTQPLVWRFRWVDGWTIIFALLVIFAAALFISPYRKDRQKVEEPIQESEDIE